MSLSLQVTVTDEAGPALAELLAQLRGRRGVNSVGAQAVKNALQAHFRMRDTEPHPRGWPKRHAWRDVSRQVAVDSVSDDGATIAIASAMLARRLNPVNPMTPKRGRFLAVAAMAAAYAAGSPREGGGPSNLAFVFGRVPPEGRWFGDRTRSGWAPALAVRETVYKEVGKPRKDGTRRSKLVHQVGTIWYWLIRNATHQADPNALPASGLLGRAAGGAMLAYLRSAVGARRTRAAA